MVNLMPDFSAVFSLVTMAAVFGLVLALITFVYKIWLGSTWKAIRANRYKIRHAGQPMIPFFYDDEQTGSKKEVM